MMKIVISTPTEMIATSNNDKNTKIMKLLHPKVARILEMDRSNTPNLVVRDKLQPKSGDLKIKPSRNLQMKDII